MKISQLLVESINPSVTLMDILEKFLPFIVDEYQLTSLPTITLSQKIDDESQPTFGRYADGDHSIELAILNRHPLDILRTLAHELVHYKQDIEGKIKQNSGETGSNIENEANELAGIAMRHFNKQHPEFFSILPVLQSK
jgi:hypothetical protein